MNSELRPFIETISTSLKPRAFLEKYLTTISCIQLEPKIYTKRHLK